MNNKHFLGVIILITALLISGCSRTAYEDSEKIESNLSVESNVSTDIMEKFNSSFSEYCDFPIISSEEYSVEAGTISLEALGEEYSTYHIYGAADIDNLIMVGGSDAYKLGVYNIPDGSFDILAEAENDKALMVYGYSDKFLIYISYTPYVEASPYDWHYIDLNSGSDITFYSSDNSVLSAKDAVVIEDKIYFHEVKAIDNGVNIYDLYEYDTANNALSIISENSCYPQIYQGKLAFIKDNTDLIVRDGGSDTVLLNLENAGLFRQSFGISISGNVVTYSYQITDKTDSELAVGSGVGYISDGERVDLIEGTEVTHWLEQLRFNNLGYAVWTCVGDSTLPVFFDLNKEAFVVVNEDMAHYSCFAPDNCVIFVSSLRDSDEIKYYIIR